MIKKAAAVFLSVIMILLAIPLWTAGAEQAVLGSGTCGPNLTWTLTEDGTLTISGAWGMEDFSKSSPAPWNSVKTRIKTVKINDGATSIGSNAFDNCTRLTSITIPSSVTRIGNQAFAGCSDLMSITIPDGVTSIGEKMFYICTSLKSITIPNSVEIIGSNAFYLCASLTSITIPDGVTSIGDYAFDRCDSLTSITIPDSLTSIGAAAFSGCYGLTGITIPDSVTRIGAGAFSNCTGLTGITIPNSVTRIENDTFFYCTSLTSVTIPDSVTSIGTRAFCCGAGLTSITIPKSVKHIEYNAFDSNLKDVYYTGSEAEWNAIAGILSGYAIPSDTVIHYHAQGPSSDAPVVPDTPAAPASGALTVDLTVADTNGKPLGSIQYDAGSGEYTPARFRLRGEIANHDFLSDFAAKDVAVTVTLPSGFSFAGGEREKTFRFASVSTMVYLDEAVSVSDPAIGMHTIGVHMTGTGIDDTDASFKLSVEPYRFDVNRYRADYLFRSDTPYGTAYIEKTFRGDTPSAVLYHSGSNNGLEQSAAFWKDMTNVEAIIDSPAGAVDIVLEKKDMYAAILWDILESSYSIPVLDEMNTVINDSYKSVYDSLTGDFELIFDLDLASHDSFSSMTAEQQKTFMDGLGDRFSAQYGGLSGVMDVSSFIGKAKSITDSGKDLVYTVAAYYAMYSMADSVKQVVMEMYRKCPRDNTSLKTALLECVTVMNSSQEELDGEILALTGIKAGKLTAEYAIDKFWGTAKDKFILAHPAAAAFMIAYEAGTFISNTLFNTDEIVEQFAKTEAVTDIKTVALAAYDQIKSDYKKNPTEQNAEVFNSAIDVMYRVLENDCDIGIAFVDAYNETVAARFSSLLGNDSAEKRRREISSLKEDWYTDHEAILVNWLYELADENPKEYEHYKHLINESGARISKRYTIACPVDVYVYDEDGTLVGSVVNGKAFAASDADIVLYTDGEKKTLLLDSAPYEIRYVGNDSGSMDIGVTEYRAGGECVRNVYFDDVPLTDGREYISKDSGAVLTDSYALSHGEDTIIPAYDTVTDPEAAAWYALYAALGETPAEEKKTETSFSSTVSEWAKAEVEEAYAEEIIPEVLIGEDLTKPVTRAEFAAIAVQLYENLSGETAQSVQNPFVDIVGNECKEDIIKAYDLNITLGTSECTFDPDVNITREQVATMLTRAYKKSEFEGWSLAKDAGFVLNYMGVQKFADDAEISDYARESVYFLVRWNVINGVGNNMFAPKGNVSLGEAYGFATREQAVCIALRSVKYLK